MFNYSNSKVTLELRDVLSSLDENGQPFKLWDFDYPSYYKDDAKTAFEQKVIDHFLFHQIGVETIARFKHNFQTRIREIMPYYIQLYKSVEIMDKIDDPFGNVDVTETFEQTSSGTSSNSETGTANAVETSNRTDTKTATENAERRVSDTPQGSISNIDDYISEGTKENVNQSEEITVQGSVETDNNSTITSEAENAGTVKHTLTRKGNQGVNTYAHDMIEFRQSFINVDMMIIGELRDLFLLIY